MNDNSSFIHHNTTDNFTMDILPSLPSGATYAFWILRIVLGVVFFVHGSQKVLGWFGGYGLKGTGDFFVNVLKIPRPLFYANAFSEFLGGMFIVVGVLPRLVALGFAASMIVATYKLHWKSGFFLNSGSDPNRGNGYEYNLALLAMSLAVAVGM
jgi:putative oxidoreductase